MNRLATIAIFAITLAGCDKVTPEQHAADVKYSQDAFCACVKTGTWASECAEKMVTCRTVGVDTQCVDQKDIFHAACLKHS